LPYRRNYGQKGCLHAYYFLSLDYYASIHVRFAGVKREWIFLLFCLFGLAVGRVIDVNTLKKPWVFWISVSFIIPSFIRKYSRCIRRKNSST